MSSGTVKAQSPIRRAARIATPLAAAVALLGTAAHAETIYTDDQLSVRQSSLERPGRGMTMKSVEAKFGAPLERHVAVGKPPITRWDYTGFTVFFEYERVIDAVVNPGS
jgi:ribonucleotide monophosphatase NagD (HAD superfamily)